MTASSYDRISIAVSPSENLETATEKAYDVMTSEWLKKMCSTDGVLESHELKETNRMHKHEI